MSGNRCSRCAGGWRREGGHAGGDNWAIIIESIELTSEREVHPDAFYSPKHDRAKRVRGY
jgi:hypothetical protein